ncbi:MAG: hypothetical protein ACJAVK_002947, partial [Akkermansiaceae bacterium]
GDGCDFKFSRFWNEAAEGFGEIRRKLISLWEPARIEEKIQASGDASIPPGNGFSIIGWFGEWREIPKFCFDASLVMSEVGGMAPFGDGGLFEAGELIPLLPH